MEDNDDKETLVVDVEESNEIKPLEKGDQLFYFDADNFLKSEHIEINCTNYD
jgi:hypothetical protein